MAMSTPSSEYDNASTGVPHSGARGQGDRREVDEEERKRVRRERNRLAAARCRDKRREKTASLVQETEELENQNDDLRKDIEVLESQRKKLEEVLTNHLPSCSGIPSASNKPNTNS